MGIVNTSVVEAKARILEMLPDFRRVKVIALNESRLIRQQSTQKVASYKAATTEYEESLKFGVIASIGHYSPLCQKPPTRDNPPSLPKGETAFLGTHAECSPRVF